LKAYHFGEEKSMAKIMGNLKITFPSEQEITENGAQENLHNLKRKVKELKHSLNSDKIPLLSEQNPPTKEITNMLVTEWNWDTALRVRGEEEREEGREEGQNLVLELMEQGYTPAEIKAKLAQTKATQTAGK
jgi:deoxyribodipyrimidine photolyase